MKVFCPNCGGDNEGMPGGRVTCRACTASFEVPAGATAPPAPEPVSVVPPPQNRPFPTSIGSGGGSSGASAGGYNPLAIASLIMAFCCSPIGVVLGFVGLSQINASNGAQKGKELAYAGIVISFLSMAVTGCSMIINAIGKH